jgi:hypothetical protein
MLEFLQKFLGGYFNFLLTGLFGSFGGGVFFFSNQNENNSDEAARNGLYHETFLNNVIIATDKQYSIVGLWQPVSEY